MKRFTILAVVLMFAALACVPLAAQSQTPVGLGVSLGTAIPSGSTQNIQSGGMSFNWGFYVNIPLIYTFHITPSAELYKLQDQNATDIDLAFKFIVPLSSFALYAGFVPGLTAFSTILDPHVGILAGVTFQLVSNLDIFIQGKYNVIFDGNQNLPVVHLNAGILFKF